MSLKTKSVLLAVSCFMALALTEQVTGGNFHYSYLTSATHTRDDRVSSAKELSSTVRIERPYTRWFPFIKYGETVYIHTYQSGDPAKAVFQRTATTRTRLRVVGFCSTGKYDLLADKPFKTVHEDYLHSYGR